MGAVPSACSAETLALPHVPLMRHRLRWLAWVLGLAAISAGCGGTIPATVPRPDQIVAFGQLYAANCSACHGAEGRGGAAIALDSPVYLAIADDAVVRQAIAQGVAGTPMPAFAQSAGGMLAPAQVSALVAGIGSWRQAGAPVGSPAPPPYAASQPGDAARGAAVYQTYCSACHGAAGQGSKGAGSIVDRSFLALVSNQELRTIVIAGRPELGAPDWRGDLPGHPLDGQQVDDVVAWLVAQRPTPQPTTPMKGAQP